jgi:hypothetical protein
MRELIFQTTAYVTHFKRLGFFPVIFGKKNVCNKRRRKEASQNKKISINFFLKRAKLVGGGRRGGELYLGSCKVGGWRRGGDW